MWLASNNNVIQKLWYAKTKVLKKEVVPLSLNREIEKEMMQSFKNCSLQKLHWFCSIKETDFVFLFLVLRNIIFF
jgi:hypothetical protein